MINENFILLTGGLGSGKTSVLNELNTQGLTVVPEVARDIIKTQRTIGGTATHQGNRSAFCDLMIKQSIRDFNKMLPIKSSVFFDRGIPDLYGYSKRFFDQMTEEVTQAVKDYRYNPTAFIFPPWFEIYSHDTERH